MNVAGKTVLITGASMGIGEALAAAFAREGASLVLAARNADLLSQVAARLPSGTPVKTVACDVTQPADVQRLATEALTLTGQVDVLINNAGIGMNGAVETLDLQAWQRCLDVNLIAPVRLTQSLLPAMKAQGGGTIVNISSVLGKVSVPYTAGYNASKYALNAISEALRLEVAPYGIHVLTVYPGSTETNFRTNSLGGQTAPKVRLYRMTPEMVAEKTVQAVKSSKRDLYITWKDALLCWFGTRFPGLADRALARAYKNRRP